MLLEILKERSAHCELCSSTDNLSAYTLGPDQTESPERSVLLCEHCLEEMSKEELQAHYWHCLQDSAWSQEPGVQILVYRLLSRLSSEDWANDLKDQIYLEDEVLQYAELGLVASEKVVDSNGAELKDGDTVSLIKSLDVKGAGFTAKQGTLVRNIRLGDDPTHIEGKVNGTSIMLKTIFLKKN